MLMKSFEAILELETAVPGRKAAILVRYLKTEYETLLLSYKCS